MARCGCNSACACGLVAGTGVTVTGNGTPGNPWTINADAAEVGAVALDTNCINMTVTGTGTVEDPFVISAAPILAAEPNGLSCTAGGLAVAPSTDVGNILVMGTDGNLLVPAGSAGAVAAGPCGITGNGTVEDPLLANVEAVWPFPCADASAGTDIYCDPATGQLKGEAPHDHLEVFVPVGPTVVTNPAPACDGGNFVTLATAPAVVVNNPSSCRSMVIDVTLGGRIRVDGPIDMLDSAFSTMKFNSGTFLSVNGGAFNEVKNDTFDIDVAAGSASASGGEMDLLIQSITIPPGGSATLQARLSFVDLNDDAIQIVHNLPGMKIVGRTI